MANFNALVSTEEAYRRAAASPYFRRHGNHFHLARGLSRRDFLKSAGAATAALMGAAMAPSMTAFAQGVRRGAPKPIPGGFELGGVFWHLEIPDHPFFPTGGPETEDPSTIGDFDGQVALGYTAGMGERLDKVTGVAEQMAYEADLRIMKGAYIDINGTQRSGAFAFI